MNDTITTIKKTGATVTPSELANFLADKILQYTNAKESVILDPACGEGALLVAISQKINGSFNYKLSGYETNCEFLKAAKNNLSKIVSEKQYQIELQDFIDFAAPCNYDLFSNSQNQEFADIIIANPPYVRTQILGAEKSRQIAKTYNLKGKIDLYFPFLIGMTNVLKKGGIMGVITSNRYLTTKSGSEIRKFLLENYDIL